MAQHPLSCRRFVSVLALVTAVGFSPALAQQAAERPLLMEGKRTLYQRVLTRPGAQMVPRVDAAGGTALPLFSVLYVYGREGTAAAGWVRVGRSSTGPAEGWVRADRLIDWQQTLTVAFPNPAGRKRVLFLRDRESLQVLAGAPDPGAEAERLRTAALTGRAATTPVVAVEPETFIDVTRNFYLLPILWADRMMTERGDPMRLLEVASVSAEVDPTPKADRLKALRDFTAGLTFVIDTTLSMDPYIDRTRMAVKRIYDRIGNTAVADRFRFGLVAFRNSVKATPALDYVAQVVHDLGAAGQPADLLDKMAQLRAATVSSSAFSEDSFAGVKLAIDQMPWEKFGGRYLVLITDASGRSSSDPLSETGLGPAELRQLAREKGVAVFVLHLMTQIGRADHDRARAQYNELAQWPQADSLYYPVAGGAVDRFGAVIDQLANDLLEQVSTTVGVPIGGVAGPTPPAPPEAGRLAQQAEIVGNAMRLAYLGRREGTTAPDVFRAWTVDRDLADPSIPSLEVRLLLTKNQLNDLSAALTLILENGLAARTAPDTFFRQLQSAALAASRDPRGLNRIEALGDLVGEYLDGLPYDSPIMRMTDDTWRQLGSIAQREFLNGIEAKLRLYREFNGRTDLWVAFDGGRNPGDAMFPLPLEALP